MSEPKNNCVICRTKAEVREFALRTEVDCPRCGRFEMSSRAQKLLGDLEPLDVVKFSGWIHDNRGVRITEEILDLLRNLKMPRIGERADKLLSALAREYPKQGLWMKVRGTPSLAALSWSVDQTETLFLLRDYLTKEMGFLVEAGETYQISPKGWAYLESLRRGSPDSQIGFIAMWFSEEVNAAWAAIAKGIEGAGYSPLRIDQKQHNNKIDDEIIAGIRKSKFLVADFTGQRGGVYFEAGFAKGIGIEVIWLCRRNQLQDVHFDTRQYNFILWEADKLTDLTEALKNRIEATLGHGPVS